MSRLISRHFYLKNAKKIRENGTEYWNVRELSEVLQYKKWENFAKVIDRAKLACQNSGKNINDDFVEVSKIVEAGAIKKKIIALGQTYFAIQTRRQGSSRLF